MKKITTLEEAFFHQLASIHNGEKQLAKALPKMAKIASNPQLADELKTHAEETEGQVDRIERIAENLKVKLEKLTCEAMEGLIEEGNKVATQIEEGPVRDVTLIVSGQQVEHFEIATYGCLVEMAKKLGFRDAVKLLQETLAEEKTADQKLNRIAITDVNEEALRVAA